MAGKGQQHQFAVGAATSPVRLAAGLIPDDEVAPTDPMGVWIATGAL
jgi:hypothetical protein